jgi:phage terminase small subunit
VPREQKRRRRGLTDLQERFARLVVETGNATEAYRRASGSKMKRAALSGNAQRLLKRTAVGLRLAELRAEVEKRTDVRTDRVVTELSRLAFSNILDFLVITEGGQVSTDLSKITREQSAAIARIETEVLLASPESLKAAGVKGKGPRLLRTTVHLHDKLPALNMLAKHLGMFERYNAQLGLAADDRLRRAADEIDQARRIAFAMGQALRDSPPAKAKA